MSSSKKIIIIGGGVSGITTALTLQLLGFKTTCYAEHLVDENAPNDPRFASLYPAASIIPHSVKTDALESLFPASLKIFEELYQHKMESLEQHRHWEIFEFPKNPPAYANYLAGFSEIDGMNRDEIPQRKEAPDLYGWVFDCFVTQWPQYLQQLYSLYKKAGGTLKKERVTADHIPGLPADIIINCTGIWSNRLFADSASPDVIRGHLVHVANKKPVYDSSQRIQSYNYTPLPSVYAAPDGSPSDVYFYPANDKWILGGSRQAGTLSESGKWAGDEHVDTINISNCDVPRTVLDLNREILSNSFQESFKDSNDMKARMGYRYSRAGVQNGLRLDTSNEYGKKIIHNYGHGGAGVTLSWGCSLNVLNLIRKETGCDSILPKNKFQHYLLNSLQLKLQKVYWNYDYH